MRLLTIDDTQKEYTVLAPLPGTTIGNSNKASLETYIPGLFNLIIGLAAVLAVAWIIWGGIEYITTDSWNGKQDGKNRIWNAIIGLFIVIGAYLILFTINPALLTLNLNIQPSTVEAPAAGTLVPSGSCTDCEVIPAGIPFKNGANVSHQIAPGLASLNSGLNSQGITGFYITEANPPSSAHADSCHNNGTCVDATIPNLTTVNQAEATKILTFYNEAKKAGFSTVIFEVSTQAEIDAWAKLGVTAVTYKNTTGSHFHIEK